MGYDSLFDARFNGNDLYSEVAGACFELPYKECLEHFPKDTLIIQHEDGDWYYATEDEIKNKALNIKKADGETDKYAIGKGRRNLAKPVLLGILYGRGDESVAEGMGITLDEAKQLKANLYKQFIEIQIFEEASLQMAREEGYVTTVCGRKRRLPDIQLPEYSFNWEDGFAPEGDILDFDELEVEVPHSKQVYYTNKLNNARGWKSRDKIIEQAKKEHIEIVSNRGKIAEAVRQTVNSRVQGCLSGDVRIQTKDLGIVKLADCVNKTVELWDGNEWTLGTVLHSGKKQKCVITFINGQKLVCSPDHMFLHMNTRGNTHFKKLSELKAGARLVVNPNFVDSDYVYSSDWAHIQMTANNAKYMYLDFVTDKFKLGQFIGRLASDGSYAMREDGGCYIRQIIAEHEFDIIPILELVSYYFGGKTDIKSCARENRNERLAYIDIHSKSLTSEIVSLDIKHRVHDNIFMDTRLLRGFISGFFDGDGGITGSHSITLTFGKQFNFCKLINDLQKALMFLGIVSFQRTYADRSVLSIRVSDAHKFCELVGFMSKDKREKSEKIYPVKDNHTFKGQTILCIKDIEITDEYIDMYDVCNTKNGYFIADGIVTHNSAADLSKRAMIELFENERLRELGFRMLIPVHDEIIAECPEENAKECSELLTQIMSHAAEEILHMPFSCDCEVSRAWYGKEYEFDFDEDEEDD